MNAKTMSDRTIQKKKRMIVTGEMKHFLDLVENTSQCIFLTGKAGTGKSSLLRMLLARISKQIVVAAPTGCSCQCGRCYPAFIVSVAFWSIHSKHRPVGIHA